MAKPCPIQCDTMVGCWYVYRLDLEATTRKNGRKHFVCVCCWPNCYKIKIVSGQELARGDSFSCGCFRNKLAAKQLVNRNTTHGKTKTPEYNAWKHMKEHCSNSGYKYYSDMGVAMCDRWLNSFENFLADMGERPSEKHSIDRWPDRYGNYEPSNCRWATPEEQVNNRRTTLFLTYRGHTLSLSRWATMLGLSRKTLESRIRAGWSLERALRGLAGQGVPNA